MSEHEDTKRTHQGFDDHHHVAPGAKPARLDPNYRAPKELKDAVWDYIHGRAPAPQDAPGTVVVPETYVHTVATIAMRELKRKGASRGFSVKVHPDAPIVELFFTRAEGLARTGATVSGHKLEVDCLTAFVGELDPVEVGTLAGQNFLRALDDALTSGR